MSDKLVVLEKSISSITKQASIFEITSKESLSEAVVLLSNLNKYLDALVEDRERLTKPINESLRAIRAKYKPTETKIDEAIASLRSGMTKFQTEQVRLQKEAEAKIIARVAPGKGNLSINKAMDKMSKIEVAEKEVATTEGLVQFRTTKKYEVMDYTMLPVDFLLPNDKLITEAMKQGRELPGVRYYEEQVPVNYR